MKDLRQLVLFGRPRFYEDGHACELTYRKGLALFAYLGVTGQRHSREALATLLWPDYSQTRARANLRDYLLDQRELLPARYRLKDEGQNV